MEQVKIRAMHDGDLDEIYAIDKTILGKDRREYWQMKMELLEQRSPMAQLVAELDGKVVGFIVGDASGWEYGVPDTVGFIDTIGIHPDYQKQGIASVLLKEMVDSFRKVGVDSVSTFVNLRDRDLLGFFEKMGFEKGDMVHIQLKI